MGSGPPASSLPDASDPALILTNPTEEERRRIWSLTHSMWGGALDQDVYMEREAYLTTVPLSRNGGITQWILTTAAPPGERPILSSCESIRKAAVATSAGGQDGDPVTEGVAQGIASVFTEEAYRGRGYASRMMSEVAKRMRTFGVDDGQETLFSVLYSDIGKTFYAKNGWKPMPSSHLSFLPEPAPATDTSSGEAAATPIGYHELAELSAVDEILLRRSLSQKAGGGKRAVALVPDLDTLLWHTMREDFMTKHIFGKTPDVRGAVYGKKGKRVWAVWSRSYYGGLKSKEGNHLYVLRLVVEDENMSEDELARALRSILELAQKEAAQWNVLDVVMWNPTPLIRGAVEKSGLQFDFVDRERDSIASMQWHGDGEVEWVVNEKFGWC